LLLLLLLALVLRGEKQMVLLLLLLVMLLEKVMLLKQLHLVLVLRRSRPCPATRTPPEHLEVSRLIPPRPAAGARDGDCPRGEELAVGVELVGWGVVVGEPPEVGACAGGVEGRLRVPVTGGDRGGG